MPDKKLQTYDTSALSKAGKQLVQYKLNVSAAVCQGSFNSTYKLLKH